MTDGIVVVTKKRGRTSSVSSTVKPGKADDGKYVSRYNEHLAFLASRTDVFSRYVPLKIGIHNDLYEMFSEKLSKREIRRFLRYHCRNRRYVSSHVAGATRYNLMGAEAGVITEEEVKRLGASFKVIQAEKRKRMLKNIASEVNKKD